MKILRIFLLALFVPVLSAQRPAPASIDGVVLLTGGNSPLAGVRLDLRAVSGGGATDGLPAPYVTTGADGRFLFTGVTSGTYRIVPSSRGYVAADYGQNRPGGVTHTVTLTPGQRLENVRLMMAPGGVISGRVTDNGKPVGIVDVYAVRLGDYTGRLAIFGVLSAKTNDLGEYRIFWLPPGRYYVVAIVADQADAGALLVSPDGDNGASVFVSRQVARAVLNRAIGSGAGDDQRHVPTFYPGTTDPERATLIDLRGGAEVNNINIDSPLQRVYRVRGRVTDRPNNYTGPVTVGLLTTNPNNVLESLLAQTNPDGAFEIARVVPGAYTLTASYGNAMGRLPVEVRDGDVNNLTVSLSRGLEVSGNVVVERETPVNPDPIPAALNVILRPEPYIWDPIGSSVRGDGTFKVPASAVAPGPLPGGYRVQVAPLLISRTAPGQVVSPLPPSLEKAYVKSIKMGAMDLLTGTLLLDRQPQEPIEIVIGTNPGAIEGRVMTDRQQPANSVWVALLPENGLKFLTDHKFTGTDPDGKFQFQNIPPGDYKIYAWENIEAFDWQEPKIMRAYESRGTAVHIDEGRKATVELTAIPPGN
jgi:CBS domain-containing protein